MRTPKEQAMLLLMLLLMYSLRITLVVILLLMLLLMYSLQITLVVILSFALRSTLVVLALALQKTLAFSKGVSEFIEDTLVYL